MLTHQVKRAASVSLSAHVHTCTHSQNQNPTHTPEGALSVSTNKSLGIWLREDIWPGPLCGQGFNTKTDAFI